MRDTPGLLWAERSTRSRWDGDALHVFVDPSPSGNRPLWLYAPGARAVSLNGISSSEWTLDATCGLLVIDLPDGNSYQVEVSF
jgi:hypothetical protein